MSPSLQLLDRDLALVEEHKDGEKDATAVRVAPRAANPSDCGYLTDDPNLPVETTNNADPNNDDRNDDEITLVGEAFGEGEEKQRKSGKVDLLDLLEYEGLGLGLLRPVNGLKENSPWKRRRVFRRDGKLGKGRRDNNFLSGEKGNKGGAKKQRGSL
ncbi:MAG: hypothetical protein LQ352_008170, partial [Teloschistes flavicans]